MGWTATAARVTVTVPKGTPPGSYTIGVRGTNQGRTVVLNLPVTVVNDVPTANLPYGAIQVGVTMGHSAANVRVLWPAATDPTSPIVGYQVQRSQDGGAWGGTIDADRHPAARPSWRWRSASSYRFRVRALDRAGNWSPWVRDADGDPRVRGRRSELLDQSARGPGSEPAARARTSRPSAASTQHARRLSLRFTGNGVAVVGVDEARTAARRTSTSTACSSGRSA